MKTNHLIDLENITNQQLLDLCKLAFDIEQSRDKYIDAARGKIMAYAFYEPSTRTQMSFLTAMLRLGGQVVGFSDPNSSSVAKGENLKDTVTILSGYSDIMVMRNPNAGSAYAASLYSRCPVINAGDGGHLHPTQTLTDIYTIYKKFGRLSGFTVGICGDLKNGRTTHSLVKTLAKFGQNHFILISTEKLTMPQVFKDYITDNNCTFEEAFCLESQMDKFDILYMTRIQRERFDSQQEYLEQKGVYILDSDKMDIAKDNMIVLHPLPRVDEIDVSVDDDPRALYFDQAVGGMYIRMALILTLLDNGLNCEQPKTIKTLSHRCTNSKCITNTEEYLPSLFFDGKDDVCVYCEENCEQFSII